jgi:hypothetical protein
MTARAAIAFLALLMTAGPAFAAEPPPLNWGRVRDLPPEALARQLFGEVGRIMYLRPIQLPDLTRYPDLALRSLTFLTRPRASYRAGVCETDSVTVEFEPVPSALGPDPPVQPSRFELSTQFIVQDLAKVREGRSSDDDRPALERACRAIDPRQVSLVAAESEYEVTGAVGLLAELVVAARAGRAPAPLECRSLAGEALREADCLRNIARLQPERTYHVELIPDCVPGDATRHCRRALVGDSPQPVDVRFEVARGSERPTRITVTAVPNMTVVID